jgi:hypothetical protein
MRRPARVTLATVAVWTVGGLWLDSQVGHSGQLFLGLLTVGVLAGLLAIQTPAVRLQTLGVVCVATVGEVIGSLIWGLYTYRLDNLPTFVPPGHGLVYLAGVSLAALCGRRVLLTVACAAAAVWGIAGLGLLPALDVAGAIGCAFLVAVLLLTRRSVYAGVFVVVAALELYGTALGTWTWASTVPGLGLAQGNPPSGVASGYVLFDVVVLSLIAWLSRRSGQSMSERSAVASTGSPALISSRAASTFSHTSQSRNPRGVPSST